MKTWNLIWKFLLLVFGIAIGFSSPYNSEASKLSDVLINRGPVFALIVLILMDAVTAFNRKAHWMPGKVLVLNAFTIQLITTINDSSSRIQSCHNYENQDRLMACLVENQMMIDSGGLVICVYIAYLIPGIVRSREGFSKAWGNIGALMLSVLVNLSKNISMATSQRPNTTSQRPNTIWFKISNTTIFTSIILLLLLLSCAVLAGKSIYKIVSQKIPLALSCCSISSKERDCKKIEDHVVKCLIVVRTCHPDYIIARSVLSSLAGLVVTICVLILSIKLILFHKHYFEPLNLAKKIRIVTELVFVLIGWIIVLWRWITTVYYFPRNHEVPRRESIVERLFPMEDFWTRSLVDDRDDVVRESTRRWFSLKRKRDVKLGKKFRSKGSGDQGRPGRRNKGSGGQKKKGRRNRKRTPSGLNWETLLIVFMRLWLQKILVLVSKACWFLSDMVYKVRCSCLDNRVEIILSSLERSPDDPFHMYKSTLECIRMPRERASSLWIANDKAFQHTQKLVYTGTEIGKSKCRELTSLIRKKSGPVEDEAVTLMEEEKCFSYLGKKSWKRRAVSLIYFIIYFYEDNNSDDSDVVDEAIEAYSQAWDLLDFVDSSDPEAKIVSGSADKDFNILLNIWKKLLKRKSRSPDGNQFVDELLACKIGQPIGQFMAKLFHEDLHEDLHDSRDWMTVAGKISLFKRWKTIDHDSTNSAKMDDNKQMLANVIAQCIEKELPKKLIENCQQWALDWKEAEISEAAFIAGKASGLSNQNGENGDAGSGRAAVDGDSDAVIGVDGESEVEGRDNDTIIEVGGEEVVSASSTIMTTNCREASGRDSDQH